METGCVVVLTTVKSTDDSHAIASRLVIERLAACVSILPAMNSIYRWEGAVETEIEQQLLIKTTVGQLPALEGRLRELHGYAVPEFIVLPVAGGSEKYLGWLRDSTT